MSFKFKPVPAVRPSTPTCAGCDKTADEVIPADWATEILGKRGTPAKVAMADGTYNTRTNRFVCDACYIAADMPAFHVNEGRGSWKVDA